VHWLLRLLGSLAAQQQLPQQQQHSVGDTAGRIHPALRSRAPGSSLLSIAPKGPLDVSDASEARVRWSPRVRTPRQRSGAAPTLSGRWPVHTLNTVQIAVKPVQASQSSRPKPRHPSAPLSQPEPIRHDKFAGGGGIDIAGSPRFRVELLPAVA